MGTRRPRKPAGLGLEGARLWAEVVAEMADDGLEPTSRERRWLEDACRTADMIGDMERALEGQPRVVKGSQGQPVAHPLIGEIRQHRTTLSALLARVQTEEPEAGSGRGSATTSYAAREAARARHQAR